MKTGMRALVAIACFAAMLAGSIALARNGVYGWTIFIALPFCAGGLTSWSIRPVSTGRALWVGAITGIIGSFSFLVLGLDGIICVLMALLPIVLLSMFGSWLVYAFLRSNDSHTAALAILLPVSFWFDVHAKPPVYSVRTSTVVNASPERVWKYAVAFPDIADPADWVFHTGLAYPKRTRIIGKGVGSARYCDLSTGPVVERVIVWDEPHELKFQVTATPPAMVETGLYGRIYPKHLTGYFISKQGQFTLTPLPHGRTLLEGTSWYQHGLWPAPYWRLWSDAIVHRIHARVLEHIRMLSEQESFAKLLRSKFMSQFAPC